MISFHVPCMQHGVKTTRLCRLNPTLVSHKTHKTKQGGDLALPTALAQQLLDAADASSLVAANTPEAQARQGMLLWAGPAAGRAPLLAHFEVWKWMDGDGGGCWSNYGGWMMGFCDVSRMRGLSMFWSVAFSPPHVDAVLSSAGCTVQAAALSRCCGFAACFDDSRMCRH